MVRGMEGQRIGAFVYARMSSTRLPGKAALQIFDTTVLERCVRIALEVKGVNRVVVLTTDQKVDERICELAVRAGASVVRGSETDLWSRTISALGEYSLDYFVRMTADNYLMQPEVIQLLLEHVISARADYGYVQPLSHFAGEIVSVKAFLEAWKAEPNLLRAQDREHLTPIFREEGLQTALGLKVVCEEVTFMGINHRANITLDTPNDLRFMREVELAFPRLRSVSELPSLRLLTNQWGDSLAAAE